MVACNHYHPENDRVLSDGGDVPGKSRVADAMGPTGEMLTRKSQYLNGRHSCGPNYGHRSIVVKLDIAAAPSGCHSRTRREISPSFQTRVSPRKRRNIRHHRRVVVSLSERGDLASCLSRRSASSCFRDELIVVFGCQRFDVQRRRAQR